MKKVKAFLRVNPPIEVDVELCHGEVKKAFLLKGRLAIIEPNREVLHLLSYVDSHNASRYIPPKHVVFMDCLYKIDDTIEGVFEPDRFYEELTYTRDIEEDLHRIWIDDQLVYKTDSVRKCARYRDQCLRERKRGNVKFKHMKIIDDAGYRTDIF